MSLTQLAESRLFGGRQLKFEHFANTLSCKMQLSVYLPPQAESEKVPALYWLSGLTCTDENFSVKAGAQRIAAELGIALIIPDTSPRGELVANDPAYDLGQGAGFYVNATEAPWTAHYRMYDYISRELPAILPVALPLTQVKSISGHSMGGHGALVLALRQPAAYRSVSAFSPICQPSQCEWGRKAFSAYLGDNVADWLAYDASALLAKAEMVPPMLVDQGDQDQFYPAQLRTDALIDAAQTSGAAQNHKTTLIRFQPGYDHSYFFISSFIEEHLRFHARFLFE